MCLPFCAYPFKLCIEYKLFIFVLRLLLYFSSLLLKQLCGPKPNSYLNCIHLKCFIDPTFLSVCFMYLSLYCEINDISALQVSSKQTAQLWIEENDLARMHYYSSLFCQFSFTVSCLLCLLPVLYCSIFSAINFSHPLL